MKKLIMTLILLLAVLTHVNADVKVVFAVTALLTGPGDAARAQQQQRVHVTSVT